MNRLVLCGTILGAMTTILAIATATRASPFDDAMKQVMMANTAAAKSQAKVDEISDEKNDLLSRYRTAVEEIESLRVYNAQLDTLVGAQDAEMTSLREQIDNVTTIARELTPLMIRMLEALEEFVGLDVPFLLKERRKRIAGLKAMMKRADVTNSEKYRRIIEAYQVENEFGRTIEAYQGNLDEDKVQRTVNFLRIGRVALIYQTIDEAEAGVWDQEARKWHLLSGAYRSAIKKGLRIARKQVAPDLIRLPIPAPRSTP